MFSITPLSFDGPFQAPHPANVHINLILPKLIY